jgi:hypothetical protein
VIGWVLAAGTIGMGMSIFSYNGGVTVGFQVDPDSSPTRRRSSPIISERYPSSGS